MPPSNQSSFSPRRRWKIGADIFVRTILILAVIVMANYLSAQFFHRFYLSSQTRVQLSPRTLSILQSLTNRVTVTVYYDKTDEFYPDILALLEEYRSANPKISVHMVDYVRDAGEAEKIAEQYKLNGTEAKNLIVFDLGGRFQIVPGDGLVQTTLEQIPNEKEREFRRKPVAFYGELKFTSVLLALENPQPLKAYFLKGHGEGALNDTGDYGFSTFAITLAQNYIAVTNLDLTGAAEIPADCNLLIIAAPIQILSEPELQKIDKYLAQGGRLFALFNCLSINHPTGLEPVLQKWGINVIADYVIDSKHTYDGQDVIVQKFGEHPVVNPLAQFSLQMILPRPIQKVDWQNPPVNAPTVTELAFSSSDSTLAGDPTAPPRSYPLIAAAEQKPVAGVVNPPGTTRIIVTGDSIFLGNHYIEGGGGGVNRDFVSYAVNWLLDRQQLLVGIGPRPVTEFRLMLMRTQQQQVRWLLLGALPGAILLLGGIAWLARRK
jgi:hypothetical protein